MKKISSIVAFLAALILFAGCTAGSGEDAAALLREVKTTQFFSDEAIASEDVNKILEAGVNAPSAMNTQPWHFTAVTDKETLEKIAGAMGSMKPPADMGDFKPDGDMPAPPDGMPNSMPAPREGAPEKTEGDKPDFAKMPAKAGVGDAPLAIIVSCADGSELDAGLAVQNMSAEAQILGYGTKILTSPTMALNGENKAEYAELLNIPEDQSVVAVLIVGKTASAEDAPDATSSATVRKAFDEVVTIIE